MFRTIDIARMKPHGVKLDEWTREQEAVENARRSSRPGAGCRDGVAVGAIGPADGIARVVRHSAREAGGTAARGGGVRAGVCGAICSAHSAASGRLNRQVVVSDAV